MSSAKELADANEANEGIAGWAQTAEENDPAQYRLQRAPNISLLSMVLTW